MKHTMGLRTTQCQMWRGPLSLCCANSLAGDRRVTSRLVAVMHVLERTAAPVFSHVLCVCQTSAPDTACRCAVLSMHLGALTRLLQHRKASVTSASPASVPADAARGSSRGLDQPCFQQESLLLQHKAA